MRVAPAEGSAILTTGYGVTLLGLGLTLRVVGRGHERRYVKRGAWFVTLIGAALVLAYGIVVYVSC